MAEFSKATYSAASYAAHRPSYPTKLYETVLAYHHGKRDFCLDLGCGHGVVTRAMAEHVERVLGTDPSAGMVAQARASTPGGDFPGVEYEEAPAEEVSALVSHASTDIVVAGQAAHWFDYSRLFPGLAHIVRPGGTLAFWGYKDGLFVECPSASRVLQHYMHGEGEHLLGKYWAQPGRSIVENLLREIHPPPGDWQDISRVEYEPDTSGRNAGQGEVLLRRAMSLLEAKAYMRTFSSYHAWKQAHPGGIDGSGRDLIDQLYDDMSEVEPSWAKARQTGGQKAWENVTVVMEWGTGILLARRKG